MITIINDINLSEKEMKKLNDFLISLYEDIRFNMNENSLCNKVVFESPEGKITKFIVENNRDFIIINDTEFLESIKASILIQVLKDSNAYNVCMDDRTFDNETRTKLTELCTSYLIDTTEESVEIQDIYSVMDLLLTIFSLASDRYCGKIVSKSLCDIISNENYHHYSISKHKIDIILKLWDIVYVISDSVEVITEDKLDYINKTITTLKSHVTDNKEEINEQNI